jgi:hypothetical protein
MRFFTETLDEYEDMDAGELLDPRQELQHESGVLHPRKDVCLRCGAPLPIDKEGWVAGPYCPGCADQLAADIESDSPTHIAPR